MKNLIRDSHAWQVFGIGALLALSVTQASAQRSPMLSDSPVSATVQAPLAPSPARSIAQPAMQPIAAPLRAPAPVAQTQKPEPAVATEMNGPGSAAAPVRSQWQATEDGDSLGSGTRALLALQVSGASAGPALPMLGQTVGVSYKRYVESFGHPIPEFFQEKVKNEGS